MALAFDRRGQIASCQIVRGISQLLPWEHAKAITQVVARCGIGGAVYIRAGIEGIERIAGGNTSVDVVECLEMIGVRSKASAPAFAKDAPHSVIHHLLWAAARATHLPNRLLRRDGRKASPDRMQRT
jgi:hypothetical protein